MKISNFPNSLPGAFFQGIYATPSVAGKSNVFWVDSNATSGNGNGSAAKPFTAVSIALNYCVAGNGDIIFCAPGHHEDIQDDNYVIDCDGLSIIGLGTGSARPSFSVSGVVDTIGYQLVGDNMLFQNLQVFGNVLDLVSPVYVDGDNITIDSCYITQQSYASYNGIFVGAGNGTVISNCEIDLSTTAGVTPQAGIFLYVAANAVKLIGNNIYGAYTGAGIYGEAGQLLTNLQLLGNVVQNTGSGAGINLVAGSTGWAIGNTLFATTLFTTGGAIYCSQNYGNTAADDGSSQVPAA